MDFDGGENSRNSDKEEELVAETEYFFDEYDDPKAAAQKLQSTFASSEQSTPCKKAPQIQAINPKVVHRICSNQVIVTLSTAVKELVENSIDAGATNIDIRLTEFGSKLIEVSDNGIGVEESNLEGLTLKHHTSKISNFQDLSSIETFGFRGEALSALCALANLSVTTKSENNNGTAYRVDYDSRGKILLKVPCAREKGTTVSLKDLFSPLPVRHKEFKKNLKREFHKMVNVLYGYCLISHGIRINCTNQSEIGTSSKILTIPALPNMKERIITLFGPKQMSSLLKVKQCDSISDEILEEFGLLEKKFNSMKYVLEGYISAPNKGRTSNDRQFFWINSRPCEPTKISRLINEIYHGYSRNQNPFVCLHIQTRQNEVDVNVTPDKRVIYLQEEKILCATLKATLLNLFSSASTDFNSTCQQMVAFSRSSIGNQNETSTASRLTSVNTANMSCHEKNDDQCKSTSLSRQKVPNPLVSLTNSKIKSLLEEFTKSKCTNNSLRNSNLLKNEKQKIKPSNSSEHDTSLVPVSGAPSSINQSIISENCFDEAQKLIIPEKEEYSKEEDNISSNMPKSEISEECEYSPFFGNSSSQKENVDEEVSLWKDSGAFVDSMGMEDSENQIHKSVSVMYDDDFDDDVNPNQLSTSIKVNWDEIKLKLSTTCNENVTEKVFSRKFRAKISPTENDSAEEELKKQITKDMFEKMEIIGQFNLGFIVVKCGPDLFIVDQHASDEKYNFETIEKTTILTGQKLIRPMDLQLPAISENIIIDNLNIFQKNGFDFDINVEGLPTTRIKMSKIPCSKSVQFGKADVEELIFMMEDCPEKTFCRPSRVKQMLASRACRMSVMIGTAMSHQEMRSLINHMGMINQPWNCPHGRPTIRHLLNLNILPDIELNEYNH